MSLSIEQTINTFWYWNPKDQWPPKNIRFVEDYTPSDRLNLTITQTALSPLQQKKLLHSWSELLPTLHSVKYLWFSSRVSQELFDAVCEMPNLEGLYIKWNRIKQIDKLKNLKKLKHLHLGNSSQIESVEVLEQMSSLITLELEQLDNISDFSVLSHLEKLEGLGLNGGDWKAQRIDTLKPLEKLHHLKYLMLINTKIKDKSFDSLLQLKELVKFNSSWNYKQTEFEKLKQLPNLKFGNIERIESYFKSKNESES